MSNWDADTSDFQITGAAWDPNQHNATHASADDLRKHHEDSLAGYSECELNGKLSLLMRMAPQFMRTWGAECRTLDAARIVCYDVMRALCVEPLVLVVRYDSLSFMGGNYWIPLDPAWVAQQIVEPHSRLFSKQKGEGVSLRLTHYKFDARLDQAVINRAELLAAFIRGIGVAGTPEVRLILSQAIASVRRSVDHLIWARNLLLRGGQLLATQASPVEWLGTGMPK